MVWIDSQYFDPETYDKAAGEYSLLICDKYDSHIIAEWIAYYIDNKIFLMILLSYSSYLTQSLDVKVFGTLKKYMMAELYPFMQTSVTRIQKVE